MSTSFRRQDIQYNLSKVIITCCDCGMQFILEAVLIGDEEVQTMEQGLIEYCPYCGKEQGGYQCPNIKN